MSEADRRFARLRLIRSANIGPVSYVQLVARFGDAQGALDALPDLARRGGGRAPVIAEERAIEREIAAVERLGARYLFLDALRRAEFDWVRRMRVGFSRGLKCNVRRSILQVVSRASVDAR